MKKLFSLQSLLWLALFLALAGSLQHVAWGFSTLEQADMVAGYVQAIAVDVGLFALAIGIQGHHKQGRPAKKLWLGVLLFSGISTYANLLHGLAFASAVGPYVPEWLADVRPFVLSGVLPILVVYLSEIAAADWNWAVQQEEKERKKAERKTAKKPVVIGEIGETDESGGVRRARAALAERRKVSKADALERLVDIYREQPDISLAAAGKLIGRGKSTVSVYRDELEKAGRISRNGDGIRVTER